VAISEQRSTGPRSGLPHGGQLVDRRLDAEEAAALASGPLPWLPLTAAEVADLRALATGAYSPLTGFMGAKEHESVTESMRLPDGTLWPIPVCLGIPDGVRVASGRLALRGEGAGELLGVLEVAEVFERDRRAEAELVYGTGDPAHPGVARVLGSPARAVAGPVKAVVAPLAGPVGARALTPAETRAAFAERGWASVVGFQTRNPVHRAHEYLMKCALEMVDGLLLHPLVGPTKEGDVPVEVRMRAYEAVLGYFPPDRVLLAALVAPMR
jgi:sulfate adenylyltransferase